MAYIIKRLGTFLDEMIDAAGERVREAEDAYRCALRGSDWTRVTGVRRVQETTGRERRAGPPMSSSRRA